MPRSATRFRPMREIHERKWKRDQPRYHSLAVKSKLASTHHETLQAKMTGPAFVTGLLAAGLLVSLPRLGRSPGPSGRRSRERATAKAVGLGLPRGWMGGSPNAPRLRVGHRPGGRPRRPGRRFRPHDRCRDRTISARSSRPSARAVPRPSHPIGRVPQDRGRQRRGRALDARSTARMPSWRSTT